MDASLFDRLRIGTVGGERLGARLLARGEHCGLICIDQQQVFHGSSPLRSTGFVLRRSHDVRAMRNSTAGRKKRRAAPYTLKRPLLAGGRDTSIATNTPAD